MFHINIKHSIKFLIFSLNFYSNFIHFDDALNFDNNVLLNEFLKKIIKQFKNLYNIQKKSLS